MSTPGMQWAQLIGQLTSQGGESFTQGLNAGTNAKNATINQQRADLEKQQQDRIAQQQDADFHQHMMEIGAKPVVDGMVKDSVPMHPIIASMLQQQPGQQPADGGASTMLDSQGNPNPGAYFGTPGTSQGLLQAMQPQQYSGNLTITRKANTSQVIKHQDHTGDTAQYELPEVGSQAWQQVQNAYAQSRANAAQQEEAAREQARVDSLNRQREQYGTTLDPDTASKYGIDPSIKLLPNEKVELATRYFPVISTGLRGDTARDVAGMKFDAQKYKTDLDATTRRAIADQRDMYERMALDHKDRWNAANNAARAYAQTNLNARAFVNSSDRDAALHANLLGKIGKESEKGMLAQQLLATNPDGTPVYADGQEFTNPFDGKKQTMGPGWRMVLKAGLQSSQQALSGYQQTAADLEAKRDSVLQRFGSAMPSLTAGSLPPGASPSGAQPAQPSGVPAAPASAPQSAREPSMANGVMPGRAHPTPSAPPTHRPYNWADANRGTPTTPGGPPAAPVVTTPVTAPLRAKVATRAQVQAYATKKGVSADQSLKEFQASGYTVQ